MSTLRTLLDKVWDAHLVSQATVDTPATVYIDFHLIHEVTSPQAFSLLRERGLKVRRPDRTLATMDHATPTNFERVGDRVVIRDAAAAAQISALEENCRAAGITLYGLDSDRQGIVHVIGPELGVTHPGRSIVCGDSHTSTHGAFGALALGIGTSEVGHVLATQCLLLEKPKRMAVTFNGSLSRGVTAKDLILGLIAKIGAGGAVGHVIEYRGTTIASLSMEERMTLCNMAVEAGGRTGMIAPDETTFEYLKGRPFAPQGTAWDEAVERWRLLRTDDGAVYDKEVTFDASALEPMVTYGTSPGMGVSIGGTVPAANGDESITKALRYMNLQPGDALRGRPIEVVFIGSCTNARISDLRLAASVFKGRRVSPGVKALVVPGSQAVKRQAEAEGLDRIFKDAGAEWREAGCSMCLAMNGDRLAPGQYSVSTSNRNFEGRQGQGGRTFLASPLTAAASAIEGRIADAREYIS
ncbi:MAG: 3-isopropylmalate dehydratase large subunit [Vicinamibacteria bacterium]|nr:3-isopropylmalate dehydratase large subunit [Vicinamibacteria bacterium]